MRLNKKGYMLVEIIVAFSIAMVMLYFLMQIVINLKDVGEDLYVETKLETDQLLMANVVMNDIVNKELTKVDASEDNTVVFTFSDGNMSKISFVKDGERTIFKYGYLMDNGDYDITSLFTKELDERLNTGFTDVSNKCFVDGEYIDCNKNSETMVDKAVLNIVLPCFTPYSDVDYGLKLNIPYVYGQIEIVEPKSELMVRNVATNTFEGIDNSSVINNDNYLASSIKKIILSVDSAIGDNAWDVSDKGNRSVMAWVSVNSDDNSMYDLHINGNGKIYANKDSSKLFANYVNVEMIEGLDVLDTSMVENANQMFYYMKSLKTLDVSSFDTSKMKNMSSMFTYLESIESLDLKNFNTSNATSMSCMFCQDYNLKDLDISSFDTSGVTLISSMFANCESLTNLDLRNFNTSKVTDMMGMFGGANIKVIRLDSFDFSNVKYHGGNDYYNSSVNSYMFSNLNNDAVIYVKDVFSKNFVEERLHEAGKNNSVIIAS